MKDFEQLIGGEIMMYQSYAKEVNANSAVFICDVDGFDDKRLKKIFLCREKPLFLETYLTKINNSL